MTAICCCRAVSKLMAQRLSVGQSANARRVFVHACVFALISGAAAGAAIYLGAGALAAFYARPGLDIPLRVVAPTVFIMAFLGVLRGFFQGRGSMIPTALSQILEQIFNAAVSVYAAWQLVNLYQTSEFRPAYGAAGGVLGTLTGAGAALVFLMVIYIRCRKGSGSRPQAGTGRAEESARAVNKALFFTIVPIILSQTVYQIGNTLDDLIFGNLMAWHGREWNGIRGGQRPSGSA